MGGSTAALRGDIENTKSDEGKALVRYCIPIILIV